MYSFLTSLDLLYSISWGFWKAFWKFKWRRHWKLNAKNNFANPFSRGLHWFPVVWKQYLLRNLGFCCVLFFRTFDKNPFSIIFKRQFCLDLGKRTQHFFLATYFLYRQENAKVKSKQQVIPISTLMQGKKIYIFARENNCWLIFLNK